MGDFCMYLSEPAVTVSPTGVRTPQDFGGTDPLIESKVAASSSIHDIPWTRISGLAAVDRRLSWRDRRCWSWSCCCGRPNYIPCPCSRGGCTFFLVEMTKQGDGCLMSSLDVSVKLSKTPRIRQCSFDCKIPKRTVGWFWS